MSKIAQKHQRVGDKENSSYFEEHLEKIYTRREEAGLDQLLDRIRAVVIQVNPGDAIHYLAELYLMTPYRFHKGYISDSHKIHVLTIKPEYPAYIVLEPLDPNYSDVFTALNSLYPRGPEKINGRYLGEIFRTKNLKETVEILESHQIRFADPKRTKNSLHKNPHFAFTQPSYYTCNTLGYTESDLLDFDELQLGEPFQLSKEEIEQLEKSDKLQRHFGLLELIHGLDHMATRVLCHEREDAILELLTLTHYYFWGAYKIDDMNSSTNITRHPDIKTELFSPAKVFTANNTPYYVGSINKLPQPTEDFVRNFGKRMHHLAYEVEDGEREDGVKNIDYVVGKLISSDIPFLAQIIGECKDIPDLKQIFSKASPYSVLITEYVQRCKGYEGFFAKENVAYLTRAAGMAEMLDKS